MLPFLSYHLFSVGSLRDCFCILDYRNLFKRAILLSTFNLLNEGYKCLLLQDFFQAFFPSPLYQKFLYTALLKYFIDLHQFHIGEQLKASRGREAPQSTFILFCRDLQIISAHWAHQSGHWHAEKIGLWWCCFVVNWHRVAGFVDEWRCGWKRWVIWADPCMCVTAASGEVQCVVYGGKSLRWSFIWTFVTLLSPLMVTEENSNIFIK